MSTKPNPPIWKTEEKCTANWDQLRGDDKQRFCDRCQKHVHNLSAMTEKERAQLNATSALPCIFYFRRKNGDIADFSLLATIRRWIPFFRWIRWTALLGLLSTLLTGCWQMGKRCSPNHVRPLPNTNSPATNAPAADQK